MREANLEVTILGDTTLCGAMLHNSRRDRPDSRVPVTSPSCDLSSDLKQHKPMVFALTAARALTLRRVTLCNESDDHACAKRDGCTDKAERDRPVDFGRQVYLTSESRIRRLRCRPMPPCSPSSSGSSSITAITAPTGPRTDVCA